VCITDNDWTDGCGYEKEIPLREGIPWEPRTDLLLDIAEQMPEVLAEYLKAHPGFQKILDAKKSAPSTGGSYAGASYDSSAPLHVGSMAGGYTVIAMERGEKTNGIDLQKGRCVWESKSGRSFILDAFSEFGTRKKLVRVRTFKDRQEALDALGGVGEGVKPRT